MRRAAVALVAIALTLGAANARAEGPSPEAVEHFTRGVKLRDEGRTEEAIAAFTASLAADASVGAYLNLGNLLGPLDPARALDHYDKGIAFAKARGDDRVADLEGARERLLARASWVRLSITADVAATPGLEVRVDGRAVDPRTAAPVFTRAGGEHTVEARAEGRAPYVVRAGDRTLVAVLLGPRLAAPAPPPPPPQEAPPPSRGWTTTRIVGAGVAGAGVAALAAGGALGIRNLIVAADLDARRDRDPTQLEAVRREREDLKGTPATLSTVLVASGAALLVGGAVLFFTAPKRDARALAVTPSVSPMGGGVSLSARF